MRIRINHKLCVAAALSALVFGCDSADTGGESGDGSTSDSDSANGSDTDARVHDDASSQGDGVTYAFQSRFTAGGSVQYSGQTKRHTLIAELTSYIGSLTDESFAAPQPGDVVAALRFYTDFANAGFAEYPIGIQAHLPLAQATMADIGAPTTLSEKMADVDAGFSANVVGYAGGTLTPSEALQHMFQQIEDLYLARFNGTIPTDPSGQAITAPYLSAEGVNYHQLVQKYLLGAVAYSQAADDYLDDDTAGKGLLAGNSEPAEDGAAYTALEHGWDEAFGYFGGARDMDEYTDDEIAKAGGRDDWQGAHDTNGDGVIDLGSEYVFGVAQNCAKRDRGAVVPTDFTADAFQAFAQGRALITEAGGDLTEEQLDSLRAHRDAILAAWENAMAATAVHYVNETLQDMSHFGTEAYSFADHAKHWSELKGFALALQFSPRHGSWSGAQLQQLHDLLGDAPVLPAISGQGATPAAEIDAYRSDLLAARSLIGERQGFAAANLGDENGENGW